MRLRIAYDYYCRSRSFVAVAAGCGGTSGDSACADSAAAHCAQRATCTNSVGITKTYGDMTTCLAREKLSCTNALAAKGTGNTPDRVEQCVAALKTESCADYFAGNVPAACVNTGTLADGAGCAFAGQCSSTYCTGLTDAACGTCGASGRVGRRLHQRRHLRARRDLLHDAGLDGHGDVVHHRGRRRRQLHALDAVRDRAVVRRHDDDGRHRHVHAGRHRRRHRVRSDVAHRAGLRSQRRALLQRDVEDVHRRHLRRERRRLRRRSDGNLIDCTAGACYGSVIGGPMPMMGTCKADAADGAACDTTNGPGCISPARCVTASGSTAGTC